MTKKKEFETVDEIIRTLIELDIHCSENNNYAELVILGGSALLIHFSLRDIEFRPILILKQ
ncbi:hypothetical protein [Alkalibacillus haloalkaliphilus]|uniref:hypothetical protein n=1 Tax=Alkalibacillus haloalkaliphilus TaxID=94136 RepID=UPI0002E02B83|nr:hypothetical protein [Alkalibacillus haloalkaliphilus]